VKECRRLRRVCSADQGEEKGARTRPSGADPGLELRSRRLRSGRRSLLRLGKRGACEGRGGRSAGRDEYRLERKA
jgi:hypothetical protein